MSKTVQTAKSWSKPELIKLGKIGDVAGSASANNNGASPNPRS
ncbi:hypothetical protein ACFFF7_10820 [Novosphingobium aquiterrae]|uniref:Lasso RiPP family leader peptide-containing protein n=1 Tax=Novosphingobium aquiterrae TaxID=624388 RepID=A0ABV6PJ93_9SPHN